MILSSPSPNQFRALVEDQPSLLEDQHVSRFRFQENRCVVCSGREKKKRENGLLGVFVVKSTSGTCAVVLSFSPDSPP
jgi:hypothetical protein